MVSADSISKHYETRAGALEILRGVSLTLDAGQSVAVMGPSGSGKSTLLNILGTLETPSAGRVAIDDTDPFSLNARDLARFRNRKIGFVFQEHHLLPQCSALENVLLPTLADGTNQEAESRAKQLLARVGLASREDHRSTELSGGERQRVAIARALINHPTLLLADEPTGNLDAKHADTIADLLVELSQQEKVSLAVVTHSERLAARFGCIYDLSDGALVARKG